MICSFSWPVIEQNISWALSLSCAGSRRCFPLLGWSVSSANQQRTHNWAQVVDCEAWVRGRVGHHCWSHTALVSKLWSSVPTGWQATTNEGDEDDWAPINSHYFTQTRRMQMRCGWPRQWCVPLDECSDGCVMYVVCAIHKNRIWKKRMGHGAWRTAWKAGGLTDLILNQQGPLARYSQCI